MSLMYTLLTPFLPVTEAPTKLNPFEMYWNVFQTHPPGRSLVFQFACTGILFAKFTKFIPDVTNISFTTNNKLPIQ
jgi:predicted ATP-grasp superfamily ATP-dependent carboligase